MTFLLNTDQGQAMETIDPTDKVSRNAPILGTWKGHAVFSIKDKDRKPGDPANGTVGRELTVTFFESGGALAATLTDDISPVTDLMVNVTLDNGKLSCIQGNTPQQCPNCEELTLNPEAHTLTGYSFPAYDPFSYGCNKTYKPDANYAVNYSKQ
jgi:hypothetical protein